MICVAPVSSVIDRTSAGLVLSSNATDGNVFGTCALRALMVMPSWTGTTFNTGSSAGGACHAECE